MARGTRPLLRLLCCAAFVLLRSAANARADDNVADAAAHNDAAQVRELLGGGTSPNQVDDNGRTGLHLAAINGNLQIAAILIKATGSSTSRTSSAIPRCTMPPISTMSRWCSCCSMSGPRSTRKTSLA